MTTRELPLAEWGRLAGTEAADAVPHLKASETRVIVVEHESRIVGCWLLVRLPHVECLWIDPAHRKTASVARRLWMGMRRLVGDLELPAVLTGAVTDDVRELLAHVGAERLPGEQYVMRFPVREEICQQQS